MRPRIAPLFLLALLALTPTPATAQSSSEVAAARTLFRQGLAAARADRWDEALERFERSYAIAPRATTLLNLAGAQVQTGQLVAGAESYRRFLAEARSGREARYRRQAERALEEVEGRLGQLVVRVDGLTDADTVLLDGDALAPAALGVEIPVDPGERTLVVQRGEREIARQSVTIGEGEHRELALDATVELDVASAGDRTSAPEAALRGDTDDVAAGGDDSGVWIGIGVAIGVLVAAGVAIGVGLWVDAENAVHQGNLGPGSLTFE